MQRHLAQVRRPSLTTLGVSLNARSRFPERRIAQTRCAHRPWEASASFIYEVYTVLTLLFFWWDWIRLIDCLPAVIPGRRTTEEDLSGSLYCRCSLMGSNRTNQVLPPQKCEYMCTFLGSITEPKLPYNLRLARDVETESLWTDIWNWISVLKQQCEAYKEITVGRASPWTSTITRCHSDQHSVPCSSPCMLMQCESFHTMFTPFSILKNL